MPEPSEASPERVFVSYRRDDASPLAHRLADELARAFGRDSVFLDVDNIRPGSDFARTLLRALRRCDVLIVLIGPAWMNPGDEHGRPRLYDPSDYVRMEIAEGLSRAIPIIPVLIDGASMPAETDLPEKIRRFHRQQGLEIHSDSFAPDVHPLIDRLAALLEEAETQRSRTAELSIRDFFEVVLPYQLRARSERAADLASEKAGSVLFDVTGDERGAWTLVVDDSGPHVVAGSTENPDLTIHITDTAMRGVLDGQFDAREALATEQLRLSGDLELLPHVAAFVFGG